MPVTVLDMQPQKVPTRVEVMGQAEGAREAEVRAGWVGFCSSACIRKASR